MARIYKLLALPLLLGGVMALVKAAEPPSGPVESGKTKGLDDALRNLRAPLAGGDPLPAIESVKKLKPRDGLVVELIAAEPVVQQPLHLSFDERGRMWVVQYRQYPFPAGLKIVEYDRYIRAKFDKVPPPPPNHFRGADRITIHTDDGSGRFATAKTFVDGLNIATSVLHGRGGIWVMNPPYLLFYPDANRDDIPDGDPVVHLSGFGLEDTHAVASSLMWGPDGWIYGAQGSTCTAKVKVEIAQEKHTTDFLGQAIWRYHPEAHRFEIYAEGGGNTFGVEFDDQGRVYSGTNWGKFRGLHYVQGGYYVKGWGKHGPLTNPYALGWFEHMPHVGNADRLTHTYIVYGGVDGLPASYRGKIIGPSPLQRRVHVTRLEPEGSSFRTAEEPFLLTSRDLWFRPVDLKAGPDGALYVADMYENRISHVDPRDNWDRQTGRLYRIRGTEAKPPAPVDLGKKSSAELVALLRQPSKWHRQTALRLLGDRKDQTILPGLRQDLLRATGQNALETLWAIHVVGGLDDATALQALSHGTSHVRRWAVRLIGDRREASPVISEQLLRLADHEMDPEVRSQLASSAKRLPGPVALPIIFSLVQRSPDLKDAHIPLLTWWALEAKAISDRDEILRRFDNPAVWQQPMVEQVILERLVQRYAMAGGDENLLACSRLLRAAPQAAQADRVLAGLEKAFAGRAASRFPDALKQAVARALQDDTSGRHLSLGVRVGHPGAVAAALAVVTSEAASRERRMEFVRMFGEVPQPICVPALLTLLRETKDHSLRQATLTALQRYDQPEIGTTVVDLYSSTWTKEPDLLLVAQTLLASRPSWASTLLDAVDAGRIAARSLALDTVRTLQRHKDPKLVQRVQKHWGTVKAVTPEAKRSQMERLVALVKGKTGDEKAGKLIFANTCAKCHKLFGEGGAVGPDLTGYERDNLGYWVENIVDPSAVIRDEYLAFLVETVDGRTLTGIIAAQDKTTVTLRFPDGQSVRLARDQIEELRASTVSLMPDEVLKDLTEQQTRDLFSYLMSRIKR